MNMLIAMAFGGIVLLPLGYALGTLLGLRQKTLYPVLRVKTQKGSIISLTKERSDGHR